MKRKFILLPITLTALAPAISFAGCTNNEIHKVKIDSGSDTININISVPEITLNKQLVISYTLINVERELDVDSSWVKFDSSSQLPLNELSYSSSFVVIPDNKVTTFDIAICLKTKAKTPEPTPPTPYAIYSLNEVEVVSEFVINVYTENLFLKGGQIYQFVINYSNIEQDFWTNGTTFHLFDEGGNISFSVLYIDIDGVKFLDKYDESKPSYEYYGETIKLFGFKKNIKDGSLLNIYTSINTTKNNVSAQYNIVKY